MWVNYFGIKLVYVQKLYFSLKKDANSCAIKIWSTSPFAKSVCTCSVGKVEFLSSEYDVKSTVGKKHGCAFSPKKM